MIFDRQAVDLTSIDLCIFQATGVGKLRPNIVFLGYKNDWQNCPVKSLLEYFNIIQ